MKNRVLRAGDGIIISHLYYYIPVPNCKMETIERKKVKVDERTRTATTRKKALPSPAIE
jgi:hypothetical protein